MKEQVIVPPERLVLRHRRDGRAVYSAEAKRALVRVCISGGNVSVSGVALAHGINANLLRRWIQRYRQTQRGAARSPVPPPAVDLLPVAVLPPPPPVQSSSKPDAPSLRVHVHGAQVEIIGTVDRQALSAVMDCLAERARRSLAGRARSNGHL